MCEIELLNEACLIHPQRIDMLIDDIENYRNYADADRTEREIMLIALKLLKAVNEENRTSRFKN